MSQVVNPDVDDFARVAVDHVASRCAQYDVKKQMCSFTAYEAVEKLSQTSVTRDYLKLHPPVFFKSSNERPANTVEPSVVLVSLSSKEDLLDDKDGHRLVFIIAYGKVRQLQACNGALGYTLAQFLEDPKYEKFRVCKSYDEFVEQWTKLTAAMNNQVLHTSSFQYSADTSADMDLEAWKKADTFTAMFEAIGSHFGSCMDRSWFLQLPIRHSGQSP